MKWLKAGLGWGALVLVCGLVALTAREVRRSVWDGRSQLILAVGQDKRMAVWQWLPGEKTWQKLALPEDLLVPIAQGYGSYRVGSLVELDRLEGKRGRLVQIGLQEALGIGIDGYMIGGETNLSWWDRIRLRFKKGREKEMSLESLVKLEREELPDGERVWVLKAGEWDRLGKSQFMDEKLRGEGLKLAIINATDHGGLAGRVERWVTNMGGVVVKVGATEPQAQSAIIVRSGVDQGSRTVVWLKGLMGVKWVEEGETGEERADVVIKVGEDYWLKVLD